jgi:hypothetical protein
MKMYECFEKPREKLEEEELSMVTVLRLLELAGALFYFQIWAKWQFLRMVVWVQPLLETVVIHTRLRAMFEPVSYTTRLLAKNI